VVLLEEMAQDPVVQLLVILFVTIGTYDALKFALSWVWKKLGGEEDEDQ